MLVRVVELGPFGCQIKRGTIKAISNIPEGYEVKKIENNSENVVVYIEPIIEPKPKRL